VLSRVRSALSFTGLWQFSLPIPWIFQSLIKQWSHPSPGRRSLPSFSKNFFSSSWRLSFFPRFLSGLFFSHWRFGSSSSYYFKFIYFLHAPLFLRVFCNPVIYPSVFVILASLLHYANYSCSFHAKSPSFFYLFLIAHLCLLLTYYTISNFKSIYPSFCILNELQCT